MIFRFRYEKRPESDYYSYINELVKRTRVKPDNVLEFMKEKGYLIEVEGMLIPDLRFVTHYRYLDLPPRPLARATWIDYIARELGINEPSARQCFEELRERGWIELVRIYIEGRWVTLFRRTILRAIVPWGGLAEIDLKIYRFDKCFEYHVKKPTSKSPEHLADFRIYSYWFEKKPEFTREYMDKLLAEFIREVFWTFSGYEALREMTMDISYEDHEIDFDEVEEVPDSRHAFIIMWRAGEKRFSLKDEEIVKAYKGYASYIKLWEWLR
jgi:hypothetical protein